MSTFTQAYIECALWSTNDESREDGGDPLDQNYSTSDLAPSALATIEADCKAFCEVNNDLFDDDSQAGHDFWLTRNGHGAGFWDGDWPEPAATELTKSAETFGECNLYIGDDGLIYC